MAKCVEKYREGKILPKIIRVSDEEAQKLVSDGKAIYMPKRLWKLQEKPNAQA